jgi:site-specific DNA recombinase
MNDVRRVATYERVSSEDQRDRDTIKTQSDAIARTLDSTPGVELVERYLDDGVSGTIEMRRRPGGRRLMEDAAAGRFDEVWIYNVKRLGRDDVDPLIVWQELERLGVTVHSVTEGISDPFMFHIHVAVAAKDRRDWLRLSADGMQRAAKDGRYCGGIVPLGYRPVPRRGTDETKKPQLFLVPSDVLLWGDLTEADVMRKILHHLAFDGWSCPRIARELNALGIPTVYQKDGRGIRGKKTRGVWTAGRIRNLAREPIYKGAKSYGRRSKYKNRDVIVAAVEPLVSEEVWDAAQRTLERNRIMPAGGVPRSYLLRSVATCARCASHYCGSQARGGTVWYRCTAALVRRNPLEEKCLGKAVRGEGLEEIVWSDIERWLRDPGDLVEELTVQEERTEHRAAAVAEATTLEKALAENQEARSRTIDYGIKGRIDEDEVDRRLAELDAQRVEITRRLDLLREAETEESAPDVAPDYLAEIRQRLDAGLDLATRQKLVQLLCRLVVHTEVAEGGKKTASVAIRYRFPAPDFAVAHVYTGTRSCRNYSNSAISLQRVVCV